MLLKKKKIKSQGRKDVPTAKGALLKATMFDLSDALWNFDSLDALKSWEVDIIHE